MSRLTALEKDKQFLASYQCAAKRTLEIVCTKAGVAYFAKAFQLGCDGNKTMLPQTMKTVSAKTKINGLTLIELLVVIFVVAILAAMLLPAGHGNKQSATLVRCLSNQKQIAIGFNVWQGDNGKLPWQISITNAGTMEYDERGYAAPNFQILSNYLPSPEIFICPTDKSKTIATNFAHFNNQNVSYFIALDLGTNQAASILTGDRHLENNGNPLKPGLFVYSNGCAMNWTHELHGNVPKPIGCLSFVDGHIEAVRDETLTSIFLSQGSATNRLAVP